MVISLFAPLLMLVLSPANADSQKVIKQCESCHGQQGNSRKNDVPSIASFSAGYMQDMMTEFKTNKRQGKRIKASPSSPETTMNEIAKQVNQNDLKAALSYFSKQRFIPVQQASNPQLAKQGRKVYDKRCMKCHGDNGNDPEEDTGILKGQWQPYLKAQLKQFQQGSRHMPKKMKKQLKKLNPQQIEALMHFFAQP
jgi:sulfide dehydrogenase cytochrome subunit